MPERAVPSQPARIAKGSLKEKYTAKELIDAVKAGNIPHENEKIVTWGLYSGINTSSVVIVLES